MVHVCFGLHDKTGKYSKFTGTAIVSIFENTKSEVTVHILHDNTLSDGNRKKFLQLAERYEQQINFYNVEEICPEKISEIKNLIPGAEESRFTAGALYRLVIVCVLPEEIEKAIYFDSDMLIHADIKNLWDTDLGEKFIAAVPESEADIICFKNLTAARHYLITSGRVKFENYFNSAVLVMNLKKLRTSKNILDEGIKFIAEHTECIYFDQDILNYCFAGDYVKLPNNFDRFVPDLRRHELNPMPEQDRIYHYTGPNPTFDFSDNLSRLYLEYFTKTTWFDIDFLKNISEGFHKFNAEQKDFATAISAVVSGKTRAFCAVPENIEFLKQAFYIRDDEEIIPYESPESLKKLVKSIKKSRGKNIFFILLTEYGDIRETLQSDGLEEWTHFVNAVDFLSDAHGIPFKSYFIVQAM